MDELAVLAIPAVLVTGLVLLGLGVDGRRRVVRPRRWPGRFQDWAAQAGVRGVRPWQVVAVCGGTGLVAGLAVLALSRSPWLGLAFAGLAAWLPLGALQARRRRRLRELREVWPDAIDNLASGVRAGLSLPEAVAGLADRGPDPLRAPFARFSDDYHATGRFGTALDRLKDELADPTADRVIEALRLAREVGGSELGRMLRALSGFLRDEQRVRKELEAGQTWVVVAARRRRPLAAVVVVTLLALVGGGVLAAQRSAGQPAEIAAAVAGYRTGVLEGSVASSARPPVRQAGGLRWRGARQGRLAGLPVVAHDYRDAAGRQLTLLRAERSFPEAVGARHPPGAAIWVAQVDGVAVLCADRPSPSLLVGPDRAQVLLAASLLGLH